MTGSLLQAHDSSVSSQSQVLQLLPVFILLSDLIRFCAASPSWCWLRVFSPKANPAAAFSCRSDIARSLLLALSQSPCQAVQWPVFLLCISCDFFRAKSRAGHLISLLASSRSAACNSPSTQSPFRRQSRSARLPFPLVISDAPSVPPVCPAFCFKPNNFSRVCFGCRRMSLLLACDLPLPCSGQLSSVCRVKGDQAVLLLSLSLSFFMSLNFVSGFQFLIVCELLQELVILLSCWIKKARDFLVRITLPR
jgi:hypothetical protein